VIPWHQGHPLPELQLDCNYCHGKDYQGDAGVARAVYNESVSDDSHGYLAANKPHERNRSAKNKCEQTLQVAEPVGDGGWSRDAQKGAGTPRMKIFG
jgi:hypothetical protein